MVKKLVCGVGVNDSDDSLSITRKINGKRIVVWQCPFYSRWLYMLQRCYSLSFQKRRPTYIGCSVCDEWLTFSNFKAWMENQDWNGKDLDKDLLVAGNKVYSQETCAFVDNATNSFLGDKKNINGLLIGVSIFKRDSSYKAQIQNPFTNKNEHIGYFSTELAAHLAWRKRKNELSCQLAELQADVRVRQALLVRYK